MDGKSGIVSALKVAIGQPTATAQPGYFSRIAHVFSLKTYQPFFDIEANDVLDRVKLALVPFNAKFNEITEVRPDLYGPVWIMNTLLLLLIVAANHSRHMVTVDYDLEIVFTAAALLYFVTFGVPVALWSLITYYGATTRYAKIACLYGYSLVIYLPITVICIMPVELVRWIVILGAMGLSIGFVIVNLHNELEEFMGRERYIVIALAVSAQLALGLSYKLYFFKYVYYSDF